MSYKISPIPFAQYLDTTTQAIASSTAAQIITFDTTTSQSGIAKGTGTGAVANSRFTLNTTGDYLFIISAIADSSSGAHNLNIWVRYAASGGTPADLANSNTIQNMSGTVNSLIAVPFIITATAIGDIVELWMSGDSTNSRILAVAAGVTPTRPAVPSIILTISKISK